MRDLAGNCSYSVGLAVSLLAATNTCLAQQPNRVSVHTVIRDFTPTHPDFMLSTADAFITTAGNLGSRLDSDGRPIYTGAGSQVDADWMDADGFVMMPPLPDAPAAPVDNFDVTDSVVLPRESFAVRFTVLGAAIQSSRYHFPVTARIRIDGTVFEPFGLFQQPVEGNVNDNQDVTGWSNQGGNPRTFIADSTFSAGTPITVEGRSWSKVSNSYSGLQSSHWRTFRTYRTDDDTPQIKVLRAGDAVPNIQGAYDQGSVESFISDYIDYQTNTIKLDNNQVIYLFELGTTYSKSSADFQDLVILVDLAKQPGDFDNNPGPGVDACGNPIGGSTGSLGAANTGSILSASSFGQWFLDVPGVNLSTRDTIHFVKEPGGTYAFSSSDFTPIDGELYRNDGVLHNRGWTMEFDAQFDFAACSGQWFEFRGDGDAWVFVDGKLAMDIGGITSGASQRVSFDRLGLSAGRKRLQFFFAQRGTGTAAFEIRTNIWLMTRSAPQYNSSALFD